MKGNGLSPTRLMAHAERVRRNLERFKAEQEADPPVDDDGVTIRIRWPYDPWELHRAYARQSRGERAA